MSTTVLFIIFLIFLTSLFDTASQLFLKHAINRLSFHVSGFKKIPEFIFKIALMPTVWLSFAFSCLSLFFWLFVLSRADLSFAFSVDSFHYVLIAIGSGVFLKEKVGFWRWIGTVLIMIGIVLVSLTGKGA